MRNKVNDFSTGQINQSFLFLLKRTKAKEKERTEKLLICHILRRDAASFTGGK